MSIISPTRKITLPTKETCNQAKFLLPSFQSCPLNFSRDTRYQMAQTSSQTRHCLPSTRVDISDKKKNTLVWQENRHQSTHMHTDSNHKLGSFHKRHRASHISKVSLKHSIASPSAWYMKENTVL